MHPLSPSVLPILLPSPPPSFLDPHTLVCSGKIAFLLLPKSLLLCVVENKGLYEKQVCVNLSIVVAVIDGYSSNF